MRLENEKQRVKEKKLEDLDVELIGRDAEVALQSLGVLRGRVVATSRYWIKLEFNNKAIYINKPFIVYIKMV
jgi:hypothetical protein